MTTNRELMNHLKKGMLVERLETPNDRGYIEAFDHAHTLVGVRMVGVPSYANLRWINPNYLRVIATPDGTAAQQTLAHQDAGGNWVVGESTTCPKPKKVVYNEEAGVMVVIWMDGQKTIVRPTENEDMNPYDAFCAAYCKRVFGSNSALKRELEKIMVVEKPKTKKNATAQMPASELGKAIKDFKEKIGALGLAGAPDPNYEN